MSSAVAEYGPPAAGTVTIGMLIAAICSWTTLHSIPWAIAHSLCSWLYVFYWAYTR